MPWRPAHLVLGLGFLLAWRAMSLVDRTWLESIPLAASALIAAQALGMGFQLLFPVVLARRLLNRPVVTRPELGQVAHELALALPATVGLFVLLISIAATWTWVAGDAFRPPGVWPYGTPPTRLPMLVAMLATAVFVAPVVEETFFRGFLYNALRLRLPLAVAVVAQAAVFALMHPYDPFRTVIVFVIGLTLAAVYEWRRTLLAPMFVHGAFNLVSSVVITLLLFRSPLLGVAGEPRPYGWVVQSVAPDSPADKAGLRDGDVITTFDGQTLRGDRDLGDLMRTKKLGDHVRLQIVRQGRPLTLEATLDRGQYP